MHKQRYNSLCLELTLAPNGPLLIKSGEASTDPSLPDMQFVRTNHAGKGEEQLYIPGSSLKGVVRSFTEKVLRTIDDRSSWKWACSTFPDKKEKTSCGDMLEDVTATEEIYARSCGACRIFGNTRLRGRASFTDFYPDGPIRTETRYGVAISRLSHAVAQGPFEMEVAVSGSFCGQLVLENYELWQLSLLAVSLNALNEGLLKIGFGKNRGFGQVAMKVNHAVIEEIGPAAADQSLHGVSSYMKSKLHSSGRTLSEIYGLANEPELGEISRPETAEAAGFYYRRIYNADGWRSITQAAASALV